MAGSKTGKAFRRSAESVKTKFGPGELASTTDELFRWLSSNPAAMQMLNQFLVQGNQFRTASAANLGRAGANTTGIGALAGTIGQNFSGMAGSQLINQLFGQAFGAGQHNIDQRLAATLGLTGMSMEGDQSDFGANLLKGLGGVLSKVPGIGPYAGAAVDAIGGQRRSG